ncbi:MAG: phosphate acyltransferase PlsX [Oscillospiraceae bacterium]|nr:phosphate acyltransferase PlsX [Oscillospiraceae bacterium]
MKIIADAFGGDNAPLAVLEGCRMAADKLPGVTIVLAGERERILECARKSEISLDGMEILDAPRVFEMDFDPVSILRENKDTSMGAGLRALADKEADAFLSAGSTGALLVGATLIVKRIRGVRRAAIGAVLPTAKKPFLLLDAGANSECTPEMLENFALLGSIYSARVLGVEKPRVALANIGEEANKGDSLRQETYARLKENRSIHFIGNIEARELPQGACDIAVTDGFTGNMLLKLYEGMGKMMKGNLEALFKRNVFSYLGAAMVLPGLKALKKQMDYKEYGGAPLLGINGVVIKAHGSSNATAIYHAVRQAEQCVKSDMTETIKTNLMKRSEP